MNAVDDPDLAACIAAAEAGDEGALDALAGALRARHRVERTHADERVLRRWSDVSVADLDAHPDGFAQVHRGDHDGFLIRGVLTPDEAAAFTDRALAAELHANVGGRLLGTSLLGLPDRVGYLAAAEGTRRRLDELFGFSFEERVEDVLRRVGGGRPVGLPAEDGRSYLPATVRVLDALAGGYRAHTGNEFVESYESYDHLRSIARTTDALSYFVLTQRPDEGGELIMYDLAWTETPDGFDREFMSPLRDARLEAYPKAYLDPGPGDMILFNGGRIWHKVADVVGDRPRVTVGGFATLSGPGDRIYYWN
ncbi:MAG: hypothetical protein U0P45_17070 [Acidimicrobiales bacterium]